MNTLYIDGSCHSNPGPGGWAVVWAEKRGNIQSHTGQTHYTTNNRMELQAAIEALGLVPEGKAATIVTDSQYVQRGATEWLSSWKRNRWRNSQKRPIANQDLWQQLDEEASKREITWDWVRAHDGCPLNEHADRLANREAERVQQPV